MISKSFTKIALTFSLLVLSTCLNLVNAQMGYWDAIRTEDHYFIVLKRANQLNFKLDFEYPFLQLLTQEQKQHYLQLNSLEARKSFMALYWRITDPNPLLPEHEWLREFIARCRFVKKNFPSNQAPYFDDRGKFYLRFGAPTLRYTDPGGLKNLDFSFFAILKELYTSPPANNYSVPANETWEYQLPQQTFLVHFVKLSEAFKVVPNLSALLRSQNSKNHTWQWFDLIYDRSAFIPEFTEAASFLDRLTSRLTQIRDSLTVAETMRRANLSTDIRTTLAGTVNGKSGSGSNASGGFFLKSKGRIGGLPPQEKLTEYIKLFQLKAMYANENMPGTFYQPKAAIKEIHFSHDFTQFRGENGKTKLDITFFVPLRDNLIKNSQQASLDSVVVQFKCLLRDQSFQPLIEVGSVKKLVQPANWPEAMTNGVEKVNLFAPAGKSEITLQVQNQHSGVLGFNKLPLIIRDFSGSTLQLSDIQLLTERPNREFNQFLPSVKIHQLLLTPYSAAEIIRTQPLFCYFEIYNLHSLSNTVEFEIELQIFKLDKKQTAANPQNRLTDLPAEAILSIKNRRTLTELSANEFIAIDLSKLQIGRHVLQITVRDPNRAQISASVKKAITIID
ncbi:MAG: GWxTD domain-containing protein [bacterium]